MATNTIDVVKAFIAAINKRNPSEMSDLMTEDHTFKDSGGNTVTGCDKMIAGWKEYFQMFPDYEIQIEDILANESIVAVFGSAAGTYNGKRGLVPENRIEMPAAWRTEVVNGKIRFWKVYADWSEGLKIIEEDKYSLADGD